MERILVHTAQLIHSVLQNKIALDEQLRTHFRQSHSEINSRSRSEIADLSYGVLRKMGLYESALSLLSRFNLLDQSLIFTLCEVADQDRIHLLDEIKPAEIFSLGAPFSEPLKKNFQVLMAKIHTRPWKNLDRTEANPLWIVELLRSNYTDEIAGSILRAWTEPAPLTVRANRIKTDPVALIRKLRAEKINAEPGRLAPDAVYTERGSSLTTLRAYQAGLFEIQDEGSQLLSVLLSPHPDECILDACAGAGGKSLHMAARMNNQGAIEADDISASKLTELKSRARRAGVTIIRTAKVKSGDNHPKKSWFDRVLVDVPCSGSGVFRRHPEKKWQLGQADLTAHSRTQLRLLNQYANATKPGGILLYSTCSVFKIENDLVVEQFLDSNPDFQLIPLLEIFRAADFTPSSNVMVDAKFLRIYSSADRFSPDGFFGAFIRRTR